jgi:hypothetical protein
MIKLYSFEKPKTFRADVKMSINGGAYNDVGNMDAPNYTTGKNYDGDVNYPTVDQYLRFRLESSIDYATSLYFYNYIYYGATITGVVSSSYAIYFNSCYGCDI